MSNYELPPEPLADVNDVFKGLDLVLPLHGVNLRGLPGGRLRDRLNEGDGRFVGIREYEPGDDASKLDYELTAEDPLHPMVVVEEGQMRPRIWIATDVLRHRHSAVDGYYAKQQLALSALISVLRTSISHTLAEPVSIVAANDRVVASDDRPRSGKRHLLFLAEGVESLMQPQLPLPETKEQPLLSELLEYIGEKANRAAVVVISDFRGPYVWPNDPSDNWKQPLETIVGKKDKGSEVIAIEIVGNEDYFMPEGFVNVEGSKRPLSGKLGQEFLKKYPENARLQQQAIDEALEEVGAIHVRLRTDDPQWHSNLTDQLKKPELRVYPQ